MSQLKKGINIIYKEIANEGKVFCSLLFRRQLKLGNISTPYLIKICLIFRLKRKKLKGYFVVNASACRTTQIRSLGGFVLKVTRGRRFISGKVYTAKVEGLKLQITSQNNSQRQAGRLC